MGLTISRKNKRGRKDGEPEVIRERVRTGYGFKMSVRSAESEPLIKAMLKAETAIPGASPTLYTNETLLSAINDYEEEQSLALCNQYIQRGGKIKHIRDFSNRTALHYAVEKKYIHVAALFLEHDVDPMVPDNDDVMALDLALKKGMDEMAAMIVKRTRSEKIREMSDEFLYNILHVKFEKTLLAVLDTFILDSGEDGCHSVYVEPLEMRNPNVMSKCLCAAMQNVETAFQILARKERKNVVCHPVMRVLIDTKWKQWARFRFSCYFFTYLLSMFVLTYSVVTASFEDDVMHYDTKVSISRGVAEIFSLIFAALTFLTELRQLCRHRLQYFKQAENYVEMTSSVLVLLTLVCRLWGMHVHWYTLAFAYILWVLRIFKYACVFSGVGTYVEALRHILMYDFIEFAAVFSIILLGFGGTFILVARGDGSLSELTDHDLANGSFWQVCYMGFRTMVEAQPAADYNDFRPLSTAVVIAFMLVTILVMLNILIAKLSNTYQNFQVDAVKGLLVHRAAIIARAEKNDFSSKIPFFKFFPCSKRTAGVEIKDTIYNVDLTTLEPKLDVSVDSKLESAVDQSFQKQVDNNLQIQTIKNRLNQYMTEMNKRIDDVETAVKRGEKYLIAIQDDVKKLLKKKGAKKDDGPLFEYDEELVKSKTATL